LPSIISGGVVYKVYWTAEDGSARSEDYVEMVAALTEANRLRTIGRAYVAMVGELPNQVGKMGVDSVEDGHLPSGEAYTWKMRRT
jgi:hypothetical protein